ncbi:multidrug resistance protein, MATE family [Loktanella fryxellensis]|uniref:Multidrug-efflux transporter n=1 Tax=Loktanella fryxellensis TaxID=245187 RepID=A0A1H8JTV6_9RHOB|nr:MATE family efflux transporter [Loktanella fryxellensis]SEN84001.1 multidrug resistance protein, MATE family [Loktanella fryxellensis]
MIQPAQTYPQHFKAALVLGVPLMLSNLAQFMIHVTDTLMLGWYDVTALAAATLASSLYFVMFILGAGFAQAVTPLVAAAAERGDVTTARRATRMAVWLSVIYGAVISLPFFVAEPILLAIGQTPAVASAGADYLWIVILGLIPALIVMVLKAFLVALEMTRMILWSTIAAAVLNVGLNYVLIFGNFGAPELGIQGAAIASVTVQVLTVIVVLAYILRRLPQYQLLRNPWRPDPSVMARVFTLGLPIGLTSLAEGGLFTASAIMMGWIGEIPLAAHGIALQLASLTFMVHIALSQAATVRAGRAVGRRDEVGLRRGGVAATAMSGVFVAITIVVFLAFPEPLIALFIDADAAARTEIMLIGTQLLALAALFQLVDAAQVMALGLLRGVQDTAVPMVIAAISYWVIAVPVSYVLAFPLGWGPQGLWLGLVVGLFFAAVALQLRFWNGRRRNPLTPLAQTN